MALLTLTTDLGEQDHLVGAVKGCLYRILPSVQQVDITHRLIPFHDAQSAYVVRTMMRQYPAGTFHLVLSNFFHYKPDQLLLASLNEQIIGVADNGLLSMILDPSSAVIRSIKMDSVRQRTLLECVETFARAFAQLQSGAVFHQTGEEPGPMQVRNPLRPLMHEDSMEGQILYIDHFENVIVNITHDEFEQQRKGRSFKIVFRRDEMIDRISESYADVPEGEKLALFNTAGYLEIAVNKGNAAGLFGLERYDEKNKSQYSQARLFYHTVRVFFE